MLSPVLERWPQALALRASSPQAAASTVAAGARLVDAMWVAAGDKSTDLNWYSKVSARSDNFKYFLKHIIKACASLEHPTRM